MGFAGLGFGVGAKAEAAGDRKRAKLDLHF